MSEQDTEISSDTFQRIFDEFNQAVVKPNRTDDFLRLFGHFRDQALKDRLTRQEKTPRLQILKVFGIERDELTHSKILAWFLDEKSEHEQGGLFMGALLKLVGIDFPNPSRYTVWREKPNRVDVAVFKREHFAVFIENKVDAAERRNQVSDQEKILCEYANNLGVVSSNCISLFLTDSGREAVTGTSGISKHIKRHDIFSAFHQALTECAAQKSSLLEALLESCLNEVLELEGNQLE